MAYIKHNTEKKVSFDTAHGPDSYPLQFWYNDDPVETEVNGQPLLQLVAGYNLIMVTSDGYELCYAKMRDELVKRGFTNIEFS